MQQKSFRFNGGPGEPCRQSSMDGRWPRACGYQSRDLPRFVQKMYNNHCLNVDAKSSVLPWLAHAKKVGWIAQNVVSAGKNVKISKMITIPLMILIVKLLVIMRLIQTKNKPLKSLFRLFYMPFFVCNWILVFMHTTILSCWNLGWFDRNVPFFRHFHFDKV